MSILHKLTAYLATHTPQTRGDHLLNNIDIEGQPFTDAAVLIILKYDQASDEISVILTERTAHLRHHAGQISLPGGKCDPEDQDVMATALREAEEELGVPQSSIRLLGVLDDYYTRTGFKISPVVGVLADQGLALKPNPNEVAKVFSLPLSYMLEGAHFQMKTLLYEGQDRYFYAIDYDEWYIWGATAGILKNLSEVIEACQKSPTEQTDIQDNSKNPLGLKQKPLQK